MSRFRPRALFFAALLLTPLLTHHTRAVAQSTSALQGTFLDAAGYPLFGTAVRVVSGPTAHLDPPWRYNLMGDALGGLSREGVAPGASLLLLDPGQRFGHAAIDRAASRRAAATRAAFARFSSSRADLGQARAHTNQQKQEVRVDDGANTPSAERSFWLLIWSCIATW